MLPVSGRGESETSEARAAVDSPWVEPAGGEIGREAAEKNRTES